jgi:hypothetical protein
MTPARPPTPTSTATATLASGAGPARGAAEVLGLWAFVVATSTIVVVASERVYWYWTGPTPASLGVTVGVYALPSAVALWALAATRARTAHQLVLVASLFAVVVEGVLTPVVYEDGPLPLLWAMFVGWHGLVAVVGFWYLTRRWLLERRVGRLAAAAIVVGLVWGVWALASAVHAPPTAAERADAGVTGEVLGAGAFATYAVAVGALWAAAHALIGRVWPRGWRPTRTSTVALAAVTLAAAATTLLAVPWAAVKLAVLAGVPLVVLVRAGREVDADAPTVLDGLAGSIRVRDTLVLLLAPLAAAGSYAGLRALPDAAAVTAPVFELLVLAQVAAGATAVVWALRGERRRRAASRPGRDVTRPPPATAWPPHPPR